MSLQMNDLCSTHLQHRYEMSLFAFHGLISDLFPQLHETNPHTPLHVQMLQELLFGQKMQL